VVRREGRRRRRRPEEADYGIITNEKEKREYKIVR